MAKRCSDKQESLPRGNLLPSEVQLARGATEVARGDAGPPFYQHHIARLIRHDGMGSQGRRGKRSSRL